MRATVCDFTDMIEADTPIFLMKHKKEHGDGSYTFASTVAFSKTIFLWMIPSRGFISFQKDIEDILNHESIHLTLYALGLDEESRMFDNLFPFHGDFKKTIERIK